MISTNLLFLLLPIINIHMLEIIKEQLFGEYWTWIFIRLVLLFEIKKWATLLNIQDNNLYVIYLKYQE